MLLKNANFWAQEAHSPLLAKNEGYLGLPENRAKAFSATRLWPSYVLNRNKKKGPSFGNEQDEEKSESVVPWNTGSDNYGNDKNESPIISLRKINKPDRIIEKDADRTFLTTEQRQLLITMLTMLKAQFNDYQQTMSYVCGTLLLFFDCRITFQLMVSLGRSPFYGMNEKLFFFFFFFGNFILKKELFGMTHIHYMYMCIHMCYWRAEAVDQIIDGFVLWKQLEQTQPELYKHLSRNTITPDTFVQKWFGGLGVQIIPTRYLIEMWSQYLQYGYRYLFKFYLSMLVQLEGKLLQMKEAHKFYEVLRLEMNSQFFITNDTKIDLKAYPQLCDQFFNQVLTRSNSSTFKFIDDLNFAKEREEAYHRHLQKRLLDAAMSNTFQSQLEGVQDDDENIDCEFCEDGFAEFLCLVCNKNLCADCKKTENEEHKLTHKLRPFT
ncbi:GTPase activating protein, GAP [Reticulomyxa filosa]|uniref:GTPase activating protein, GAP n=1 Tax=Reticulomyxa filosa TaxID=46433 RepID=X6LWH1_RETFI|nr:GTPase activating protein, GAP [Reticulomyxa filosa]|eukprot:ETO05721.1 GTPase activating protein, GAP [Reticulomyxa filosa]